MKRNPILPTIALTLLLLTSCATPGEPFGSPGGVGTELTVSDTPSVEPSAESSPSATPTAMPSVPAPNLEYTSDAPSIAPVVTGTQDDLIRINTGQSSAIPYDGTDLVDELWDLAELLNRVSIFENHLIYRDGVIEIDWFSIMFYPYGNGTIRSHSLYEQGKKDEYAILIEKYSYEDFVETSLADACFNNIFSKQAKNIVPTYRNSVRCIEDGTLLGFSATGVDVNTDIILRELTINDDTIELSFSTIIVDSEEPATVDSVYIGKIEGDEYVFTPEELDQLRIVKYTFVLEDGKYKILSIELTKG